MNETNYPEGEEQETSNILPSPESEQGIEASKWSVINDGDKAIKINCNKSADQNNQDHKRWRTQIIIEKIVGEKSELSMCKASRKPKKRTPEPSDARKSCVDDCPVAKVLAERKKTPPPPPDEVNKRRMEEIEKVDSGPMKKRDNEEGIPKGRCDCLQQAPSRSMPKKEDQHGQKQTDAKNTSSGNFAKRTKRQDEKGNFKLRIDEMLNCRSRGISKLKPSKGDLQQGGIARETTKRRVEECACYPRQDGAGQKFSTTNSWKSPQISHKNEENTVLTDDVDHSRRNRCLPQKATNSLKGRRDASKVTLCSECKRNIGNNEVEKRQKPKERKDTNNGRPSIENGEGKKQLWMWKSCRYAEMPQEDRTGEKIKVSGIGMARSENEERVSRQCDCRANSKEEKTKVCGIGGKRKGDYLDKDSKKGQRKGKRQEAGKEDLARRNSKKLLGIFRIRKDRNKNNKFKKNDQYVQPEPPRENETHYKFLQPKQMRLWNTCKMKDVSCQCVPPSNLGTQYSSQQTQNGGK